MTLSTIDRHYVILYNINYTTACYTFLINALERVRAQSNLVRVALVSKVDTMFDIMVSKVSKVGVNGMCV